MPVVVDESNFCVFLTHLGKTSVDDEIQQATEELVPHHNCHKEIAQNQGAGVLARIMPD